MTTLGIAVVDEAAIVHVWRGHVLRVPNGTPVLFGAVGDLTDVGKNAIGVPAEDAIGFLNGVQVREVVTIDHDILRAAHRRDAIHAKADRLVESDPTRRATRSAKSTTR